MNPISMIHQLKKYVRRLTHIHFKTDDSKFRLKILSTNRQDDINEIDASDMDLPKMATRQETGSDGPEACYEQCLYTCATGRTCHIFAGRTPGSNNLERQMCDLRVKYEVEFLP